MNIGFYDPISESWIKPRPEKQEPVAPPVSAGEALLIAVAAKAEQERCDRIWAITKQVAEGCNSVESSPIVTSEPPEYVEPSSPVMIMQVIFGNDWASTPQIDWSGPAPIAAEPTQEYEIAESLGYVYWKPKVKI